MGAVPSGFTSAKTVGAGLKALNAAFSAALT